MYDFAMKTAATALIALLATTLPDGLATAAGSFDRNKLKTACQADWPSDFDMQKYCLDKKNAAADILAAKKWPFPSDEIEQKCYIDWPQNPEMILYCLEGQATAMQQLKPANAPQGIPDNVLKAINDKCWPDWFPDLDMIVYCRNKQVAAWLSLNK